MSRIGNMPVKIASGATVIVDGRTVKATGKQGELAFQLPENINVAVANGHVNVQRADDSRQSRGYHGLVRTMIANMVDGVTNGYTKHLEIQGVGFKAVIKGQSLSLALGFASPVEFAIPKGVKITEEGGVKLVIQGADKQLVGDVAARIRSFFPAEPYKGKGIRYKNEHVRRKVGKTVA